MKRRFGLLVLALLVLAACGQRIAAEEAERSFRISNDPDEKLIYLASHPESTRFATAFALYGDGRLVREKINQGNQDVVETSESVLTYADIESLVRLSVEAGLVDLTREALLDSVGGRMPKRDDGRSVRLRISLEEYRGPSQSEAAPIVREIWMPSPSYLSGLFPQLGTIRGLLDLEEALDAYAPAATAAKD